MRKYKITYDLNDPDPPKEHERNAAIIIANHFQSDILFIRKGIGKTPDLMVVKTHQIWELKSPLGNGKRTISNNLRDAAHQSSKVILDLSRCKMNNINAMSRINEFLASGDAHLNNLLVIDKSGKAIDILKKKR